MAITVYGLEDAQIAQAANINPIKMRHRHRHSVSQETGTAVVAQISHLFIARGTGTLKAFEAAITGAIATGADRTVTIDLKKGNAGAGFATVLSATIVFNNGSSLRAISAAAFADAVVADGDIFQVTVTVAGAAGNQAQGLVITLEVEEAA